MIRKLGLFFAVMFIFTQVAIAAPDEVVLTEDDAGSQITLGEDSIAVIELESQPSIGYEWRPNFQRDGSVEILGRQFVPEGPDMPGVIGIERIYIGATGKSRGPSDLTFTLTPPGNSENTRGEKSVTFKFTTEGKLRETFQMPELESDRQAADAQAPDRNADEHLARALPSKYV